MNTSVPLDKPPKGAGGEEGFTFGGHSLSYPTSSTDYYHVITTFENPEGGGLLIGTKIPVDQSRYEKTTSPADDHKPGAAP